MHCKIFLSIVLVQRTPPALWGKRGDSELKMCCTKKYAIDTRRVANSLLNSILDAWVFIQSALLLINSIDDLQGHFDSHDTMVECLG